MNTQTTLTLTLSAVKYIASMSEETACFQAVVHIDGKPVFRAENTGKGGQTSFSPLKGDEASYAQMREAVARVKAYALTLPGASTFEPAESLVDQALDDYLLAKDYIRMSKTKLVVIQGKDLYSYKLTGGKTPATLTPEGRERIVADIVKKNPGAEVLNFMPNDGGCARYVEHARAQS